MLALDLLYDPYSTLRRLRREDVEGYEDITMIRNGKKAVEGNTAQGGERGLGSKSSLEQMSF